MNELTDFLIENDVTNITEDIRVSKRIPFDFTIKAVSAKKFKEIQARCKGRISKKGVDPDVSKFQTLMCLEGTVEPNFTNASFINSLGVLTPTEAIDKVLLPGEQTELYIKISDLSGFNREITEEDIDEIKN